jgi:hypothetical protein
MSINSFGTLFASKSRRAPFDVDMVIESLTDVPLVYGTFFCKWKVRNALNDHKGRTQRHPRSPSRRLISY